MHARWSRASLAERRNQRDPWQRRADMPSWVRYCLRGQPVPSGLLPILILIAVIIVYVIAKVVAYVRLSEEQWKQVDKSKLREWEDDD